MFLGNGSINTFPQQRIEAQQWRYCWKLGVSVPRSCLEDNWGDQATSVRASVKRGLERVKLKSPLLEAVARERLVKTVDWKKA
jgi:hypothetical protein